MRKVSLGTAFCLLVFAGSIFADTRVSAMIDETSQMIRDGEAPDIAKATLPAKVRTFVQSSMKEADYNTPCVVELIVYTQHSVVLRYMLAKKAHRIVERSHQGIAIAESDLSYLKGELEIMSQAVHAVCPEDIGSNV